MSDHVVDHDRRRFLTNSTAVVGGVGVVGAAVPFVGSFQPSARAEAAGAPVQFDLGNMQPGERVTVEWRGKPVWVVRRTQEALQSLNKTEVRVADPKSEKPQQGKYAANQHRSINPDYLVLVGLCTHLGCVPLYEDNGNADAGRSEMGFFCPCHGSRFDIAGRVFKSVPAPLNLEVPPYKFLSATTIVIGEEDEEAA